MPIASSALSRKYGFFHVLADCIVYIGTGRYIEYIVHRYLLFSEIMDQNNAKIVLILLFSLGLLVQARPSLLDAIKNVRELGVGTCSIEKYSELTQTMQECSQQKQAELQSGGQGSSFTLCSIIDPMLQCNFTEFLQYAITINNNNTKYGPENF